MVGNKVGSSDSYICLISHGHIQLNAGSLLHHTLRVVTYGATYRIRVDSSMRIRVRIHARKVVVGLLRRAKVCVVHGVSSVEADDGSGVQRLHTSQKHQELARPYTLEYEDIANSNRSG